jgi:hypothetical protein
MARKPVTNSVVPMLAAYLDGAVRGPKAAAEHVVPNDA